MKYAKKAGRRPLPDNEKMNQRFSFMADKKHAEMLVFIADKTDESFSAIVRRLLKKEFKRVSKL